ncbi:hypothetical protein A1D23_02145 [Chelonobacter oris]|uniref:hypothetical protein n=1 Tax=Chelonobacter oris TaxID=505317 RepID=UPI0024494DC6|nr:hypothetical protein [Chelonobacter oris]MDH3000837.1 hypothetical protein [Chelonobacter oris]
MSEKAGDIHIDVSMDTASLLSSATSADLAIAKFNKRLDRASKTADKLDKALNKAGTSLSV